MGNNRPIKKAARPEGRTAFKQQRKVKSKLLSVDWLSSFEVSDEEWKTH